MNTQDIRVKKTKKNIYDALLDLMLQKPLHKIHITELCQSAQINRGTFYSHYEQIDDVFKEYTEMINADMRSSYYEPYRTLKEMRVDKLNVQMIQIFHHVERFKRYYKIIFSDRTPMWFYRQLHAQLSGLFLEHTIHGEEQLSAEMVASYQANAIIGMMLIWSESDFKESAENMNEQLIKVLKIKNTY